MGWGIGSLLRVVWHTKVLRHEAYTDQFTLGYVVRCSCKKSIPIYTGGSL